MSFFCCLGGTTNSDDNEGFKDDGFETQSNASSSQTNDSHPTKTDPETATNHKLAAYLAYTNNSFLPEDVQLRRTTSPGSTTNSDSEKWLDLKLNNSSNFDTEKSIEALLDTEKELNKNEKCPRLPISIEKGSTSRTAKSLKQIKQTKTTTVKQDNSSALSRGKPVFRPISVTLTKTPPMQKKPVQCSNQNLSTKRMHQRERTMSNSNLSSIPTRVTNIHVSV